MKSLNVVLGRYDDPEKQVQDDYSVDLYKSNIAIFGSSMSGKTTLLKTLIFNIHKTYGITDKEEIYILDFSDGLKKCSELPYVTGYFDASNEENIRRVFKVLKDKLNSNIKALPGISYFESNGQERPPHITFIIDGFSNFISDDNFFAYQESLKKIARDGLSKGVTVIIAGSEISGFSKVASSFGRIIALDLLKDYYAELFSGKVEKPLNLQGRGLVNNTDNAVYEFQAYLPWNYSLSDTTEEKQVRALCEEIYTSKRLEEFFGKRKIKSIPNTNLTAENWSNYSTYKLPDGDGRFVAGLDYYSLEPVPSVKPQPLNLKEAQSIAIYGRKEFGKSNLLKLLLEATRNIPDVRYCFWEDGRGGLTKPSGLNDVIEQLENKRIVSNKRDFFINMSQMLDMDLVDESVDQDIDLYSLEEQPEYKLKEDLISKIYARYAEIKQELDELEELASVGKISYEECEQRQRELYNEEDKLSERENELRSQHYEVDFAPQKQSVSLEKVPAKQNNSFNVFVIQSRLLYECKTQNNDEHLLFTISHIIKENVGNVLFIFSDTQHIKDNDVRIEFNHSIRYAFLLDDIVRFVNNTKGSYSVFESQDVIDLKENFGPCEVGDGFFYDVDRETISKLRFIYSNPKGE